MNEAEIKELMGRIRNKKISVDEAVKKLKFLPFEDLGFVKIDHHRALRKGFPDVVFCKNAQYNEKSRTIVINKKNKIQGKGKILVITAGTSDIRVAEEASIVAEAMGNNV